MYKGVTLAKVSFCFIHIVTMDKTSVFIGLMGTLAHYAPYATTLAKQRDWYGQ